MMWLPLLVLAQTTQPLAELFPLRARVTVPQDGPWSRLPLTEAVLSQSAPDLSDVRLLDQDFTAVPFVVRSAAPVAPRRSEPLERTASERRQVPDPRGGPATFEEVATFQLATVPEPAEAVALQLRIDPSNFVRLAQLEVLGAKNEVLATQRTTVFRLAHRQERTRLELPALPRDARALRLTLTGQGGPFLEPAAQLDLSGQQPRITTLDWPLEGAPSRDAGGTVWRFEVPRGIAPRALRFETSTAWFDRAVTVRSGARTIGQGQLFRVAGQPGFEVLEVPVDEDRPSAQLEVRVDDGDSPPLQSPRLTLVLERPELVFTTPSSERLWLYFGGHRTRAPRFDTGRISPQLLPAEVPVATLEAIDRNPAYVEVDPLRDVRRAGAAVNVAAFRTVAPVEVKTNGPQVVTFDGTQALGMREGMADLRLVDAEGRQWPYVVRTELADVRLDVKVRQTTGSTYLSVDLPRTPKTFRVVVPAGTPYFSRDAVVTYAASDKLPTVIGSEQLTWNPSIDGQPSALEVDLYGVELGAGTYELELKNGSDAAVTGLGLDATVVSPRLLTAVPAGRYRALWGAPGEKPPRYDLVAMTPMLEALKAEPVAAGAAKANPDYVEPGLIERSGGVSRVVFWVSLIAAVVVLSVLALRTRPE